MTSDNPGDRNRPFDLAIPATDARPATRLTHLIIAEALKLGSDKIHIHNDGTSVLYLIEGEWKPVMQVPPPVFPQLVNRLRVMANLDRTEGHERQQGSFEVVDGDATRTVNIVVQYTESDEEETYLDL